MRACRTARRGIFRFKFSYCDRGILLSRLLKALASRGFAKRALRARSLQTKLRRETSSKFALQCRFNTAARRFLLCSTEFVPLRNDKIYGAFSLAAGLAVRRVCFAGQILRRPIKFKYGRNLIAGVRLNFKRTYG